jgi:hypothetical protein
VSGFLLFYLLLGAVIVGLAVVGARQGLRTIRRVKGLEAADALLRKDLAQVNLLHEDTQRNLESARAELAAMEAAATDPNSAPSGLTVLATAKQIKDGCAELREGATEINGIWCSRYDTAEIVAYFRQEHQALIDNEGLRVRRVINPKAVGEAWGEFRDLWSRSPVQSRWDVRINESLADTELMYVRYPEGHGVGVLQINELGDQTKPPDPAICFIFDPRTNQWLKNGVNFIDRWFTNIFNSDASVPLQPSHVRTWGPPVPERWDATVRDNPDLPAHFRVFLKQEQTHLTDLIAQQAALGDRKVCVVEIGCATGRTLLECIDACNPASLEYLIGFDSSRDMIHEAVVNLRKLKAQSEDDTDRQRALSRVRLCVLDAESLTRHFVDGSITSPPASTLPGVSLHWHPEETAVESHAYDESRKVFCCMLNTLGDLRDETRLELLEAMVRSLGVDDILCLSLLAGESFAWAAPDYYTRLRDVTRATEEEEDFDIESATMSTATTPQYWTRWMFRTSPSPAVKHDVTVEGLLDSVRARLKGDFAIHWDIMHMPAPDPACALGHFVAIKRVSA